MKLKYLLIIAVFLFSSASFASGNDTIQSFSKAKKHLEREVYADHRETIYCAAAFDADKNITPPPGFTTEKHIKRAKKLEWEHVVPAENFGRTFTEWREGHAQCVSSKGKSFKGRKCAEKMNLEYRYMQSDMYNLFPAIGAVNAMRSNYNFVASVDAISGFGSCDMKISDRKAEPPANARGRIARTYLYMDETYKRYSMSKSQKQLMSAWDKMHPVSEWECKRAVRIEEIQGSKNQIMAARCK
ncbi:MAG: endonuclease [Pseudomonadales bacterium]|nr:endonuclease [Pseudomonadales bacterium]